MDHFDLLVHYKSATVRASHVWALNCCCCCCCCRPHSTNVLAAESSTRNHVAASSLSPQVARKGSTLSGFVQRSRLEREVGRDLHSNKWEEVWSCIRQSGHSGEGCRGSPMEKRYETRSGDLFVRSSLKLSSSISKVGHIVGKINWHISALWVVKFMPHKFHDCLSSAWLTGLITERSQKWSDESNFVIVVEHTTSLIGGNIAISRVWPNLWVGTVTAW